MTTVIDIISPCDDQGCTLSVPSERLGVIKVTKESIIRRVCKNAKAYLSGDEKAVWKSWVTVLKRDGCNFGDDNTLDVECERYIVITVIY